MKPTTLAAALGVTKIFLTKIGQPYICQQTKECFDLSIKAFQNHRKQAKIKIVFYCFPLLGLIKPP